MLPTPVGTTRLPDTVILPRPESTPSPQSTLVHRNKPTMHKILLMADDALALSGMALAASLTSVNQSMIAKSGSRFSEKIMLKQKVRL
jgi:hypothetical protein